jgi:hypothetical protein
MFTLFFASLLALREREATLWLLCYISCGAAASHSSLLFSAAFLGMSSMLGPVSLLRLVRHKPITWAAPWKNIMLDTCSSSFTPDENLKVGNFHLFVPCWTWRKYYGKWVYSSPNLCSYSRWPPTWYPFPSVHWFHAIHNLDPQCLLAAPPQKPCMVDIYFSLLFPSPGTQGETKNWVFSLLHWAELDRETMASKYHRISSWLHSSRFCASCHIGAY